MNRLCALGALLLLLPVAQAVAFAADKVVPVTEVTLRVVNPAQPALLLTSETDVEAKEVVYWVELWNVDNPADTAPLPIPDGALARLGPHGTSDPIILFNTPDIRAGIKRGDRIIGSLAVHCGNCAHGYSYRVYFTYGEGGWLTESRDVTTGALFVPRGSDQDGISPGQIKDTLLSWIVVENEPRIPIAPATK